MFSAIYIFLLKNPLSIVKIGKTHYCARFGQYIKNPPFKKNQDHTWHYA